MQLADRDFSSVNTASKQFVTHTNLSLESHSNTNSRVIGKAIRSGFILPHILVEWVSFRGVDNRSDVES